jgi:ubiquinone/menaquinone biosynthesis C-methylase UbiE
LLDALPGSCSVLYVGCGAGRISVNLAERGYTVTGIDVSEALLSVARENARQQGQDIRFVHTDGLTIPFQDESFDMLIGFKILCYIPTRALRHDYLRKLYRVLKPNGLCVLTQHIVPEEYVDEAKDEHFDKSPASQFNILEKGDHFPQGTGYVRWFTEQELYTELDSSDFLIELFESDAPDAGEGYMRLIQLRKA